MSNKIAVKILFYGLVVLTAFAFILLYQKTTGFGTMTANTNVQADTNTSAQTCIITIDGQRYDVEPLRTTHTGGDIFQCGTDMSAVFHNQHGDNLQMIQRYLIK